MTTVVDLTGKRFGRLTVLSRGGNTKDKRSTWLCLFDCGNCKVVRASNLIAGQTKSCGCLYYESRKNAAQKVKGEKSHLYKHGLSKSRINSIYRGIKKRCYNHNEPSYPNYGGRGIRMCDIWENDFMPFYRWSMENGYSDTLSIDRIDVDGDYCPENCRWVDWKTQQNNRRNNKVIEYNGVSHTVAEWADISGVKRKTLYKRLNNGWEFERAITAIQPKR